ncbi:hypothetical protein [Streptomyces sp. XY533]|uniref:hypothetical protein n=1 Tax=Streptomyces sp. XY533 TaxID=1519481 RepID=UPI0006AF065A|nr:hypothetical protein [Streptomyces sp. XY533]KOV07521.1 hypothetical protein ADK92_05770 [Streptomyces sp. XY533]
MPISYSDQQIQDKAVELSLISAGQELPRNLRGKVVAALAAGDAAERQQAPEPQLAGEIVIHGNAILVDGEPFPWLVATQPMEIGLNPDGVSTVRMTLMAATVQIIRPEPRPESEH